MTKKWIKAALFVAAVGLLAQAVGVFEETRTGAKTPNESSRQLCIPHYGLCVSPSLLLGSPVRLPWTG